MWGFELQSVARRADTSPYEPQPTGTFISRMSHLLVPMAIDPPFFSLSRLGFVDATGNNHNGRRRRQPRNVNQPTDATARHATVPHTTADGPPRPHGEGLLGVVRPARRPQGLPGQDPEGREAHHLRRGAEGERAAKRTKTGLCLSRADRLYVLQGRGVFLFFLDKKGAASVPRAGSEKRHAFCNFSAVEEAHTATDGYPCSVSATCSVLRPFSVRASLSQNPPLRREVGLRTCTLAVIYTRSTLGVILFLDCCRFVSVCFRPRGLGEDVREDAGGGPLRQGGQEVHRHMGKGEGDG